MAFKRIQKGAHIAPHGPMELSVTKSGFSLGSGIATHFGEHTCAEIHLDNEGKRIGFRPTSNMIEGFKLSKAGRSWGLSAGAVSKRIPIGKYNARFEDDMVVIDVPEIAAK